MIYIGYLHEKVGHLVQCIQRLPKSSDELWELSAVIMYARVIGEEAAKLQNEIEREGG